MRILLYLGLLAPLTLAAADKKSVRPPRVPPEGIAIPASDRASLEAGVAELGSKLQALAGRYASDPNISNLLAHVEIYHKAVDWALRYDEFFRSNEVGMARGLLQRGSQRAQAIGTGKMGWLASTGLVTRGYVSKLDGSVQPYGLVVPASFRPGSAHKHRLDVWLHGRDDHLTELKFLADSERSAGGFAAS